MCGIIGYIGDNPAMPILIEGLKRLEYRGYDSAGMAILENGTLTIEKTEGKIAELEGLVNGTQAATGHRGHRPHALGDARRAQHGRTPTRTTDCSGEVAVVHNGIIENYPALKQQPRASEGHKFVTETDTEVLAHLIEEFYTEGDLWRRRCASALKQRRGHLRHRGRRTPTSPTRSSARATAARWSSASATARTSSPPTWPPSSGTPGRSSTSTTARWSRS